MIDPVAIESGNATEEKSAKRGRAASPEFDVLTGVDANGNSLVDPKDGKLIGIPVNYDLSFAKLGSRSFANKPLYFRYLAFVAGLRAEKCLADQKEFEYQAVLAENPDSREAKVSKLEKLKAQLAALEAQLAESGVL